MSWLNSGFDDEGYNLYASPSQIEASGSQAALFGKIGQPIDPQMMYAWERNRLLFNTVLIVWTLMLALVLRACRFYQCALLGMRHRRGLRCQLLLLRRPRC